MFTDRGYFFLLKNYLLSENIIFLTCALCILFLFLFCKKDGRLVAKPLSNDQTPYRKDERERIKKTGARVLSMDQIEGIEPVHENWGDLNLGNFSLAHIHLYHLWAPVVSWL